MKSMTGFGAASEISTDGKFTIRTEISTVNRKQLEIKISCPQELLEFDPEIRKTVQEYISRGQVSIRINITEANGNIPDFTKLLVIWQAAEKFRADNNIPGQITISDLIPFCCNQTADIMKYKNSDFKSALFSSLKKALAALSAMRAEEGEKLKTDIMLRLTKLEEYTAKAEPLAAELSKNQLARIREKIAEALGEAEISEERIVQEAVILNDRYDVTEELTRLKCHFEHFKKLAASHEPSGRSLDFLIQEIFRECNTLGSKAQSSEITEIVVAFKNELEKIREQEQNIE